MQRDGCRPGKGMGVFRRRLQEIMDPYTGGPQASIWSLVMDLFILACILASCAIVVLELTHPEHAAAFWKLELTFTAIFVVEYALRWVAAPNRRVYPITFYAVIDLLAILPTLLMLGHEMLLLRAVRGIRLLRLLRLLRLIRILKVIRYGFLIYRGCVRARIWWSALNYQYRLRELGSLFLWAVLAWFIGANLLHLTESRLYPGEGPFAAYWQSYWNTIIVLVSGIEDKEPLSLLGRVEVSVMLITGIIVVGLLTGEIVSMIVRRVQRAGKVAVKPPKANLEHHIVIIGRNSHLDNVIRQIHAALRGRHYLLVVSPDAEEIAITDPAVYRRVLALAGDPLSAHIMEKACVDKAFRVLVLSPDVEDRNPVDRDNMALMATLVVINRRRWLPVVVQLQSKESMAYAQNLQGIDFLDGRAYGVRFLSQAVLNPGVTKIYDELLTFTSDSNEFYTIDVPPRLIGCSYWDAQLAFLDWETEAIVLVGLDRSPLERPNTRFWINPIVGEEGLTEADLVLAQGDRFIVMAYDRPLFDTLSQEDLWTGRVLSRN